MIIIIDEKLIILKHYLKSHPYEKRDIAEIFEVSERQFIRWIKKWEEEGFLSYHAGQGRGNLSRIIFNKDLDTSFTMEVIRRIDRYSATELNRILSLPISEQAKTEIISAADNTLTQSVVQHQQYLSMQMHPDDSGLLLYLIADKLYRIEDGKVVPQLVIFEEWRGNQLTIHLKRNIRFSDGTYLFAVDVVAILERFFESINYRLVKSFQVTGVYNFMVTLERYTPQLKFILASNAAAIYKIVNHQMIGTGPYCIADQNKGKLKLLQNPYSTWTSSNIGTITISDEPGESYTALFPVYETKCIRPSRDTDNFKEIMVVNAHLMDPLVRDEYKHVRIIPCTWDEFLYYKFEDSTIDAVIIYDTSGKENNYDSLMNWYHDDSRKNVTVRKVGFLKYKVPTHCKNISLTSEGYLDVRRMFREMG